MIRLLTTLVSLVRDILSCLNHILLVLQEYTIQRDPAVRDLQQQMNNALFLGATDSDAYTEDALCTIGEACLAMKVSRSTIDRLRAEGKLSSLEKNGRIRLLKKEVEGAKIWYSVRKGKL